MRPPLLPNEAARLAALHGYQVLDTAAEHSFDDITLLASQICGVPIALISFVDRDRQWFKAKTGLSVEETARDLAFCAHAITQTDVFVVSDTLSDKRFVSNPLVTGEPRIRFYAGAPLVTDEGHALGTLCVIDRVPRELTASQREALQTLSRQVMLLLELRRNGAALARSNEALARDLDGRRRVEEALRESEARYRVVTETASDAIITIDETSTMLFVNAAAEKIFGHPLDELKGASLSMLMPDYLRHVHRAGMRRYVETGQRHVSWEAVEVPGLHRDGHEIPLEISFGEFKRDGARFFTGIIRDVTERKRAEEAIHKSEEYRNLFRHANDAIMIFEPESEVVIDVNDRACEIYGIPREEFIGRSIRAMSQDAARGERQLEHLLQEGKYQEFESVQYRADGTPIHFLINASVIEFQGRRAVLTINRDVTEQKRAAEALRESEAQFRLLVEGAQDYAIFMLDPQGHVVSWNAGAEHIKGYSADEIVGQPHSVFYTAEDVERGLPGAGLEVTAREGRWDDEGWRVRKDGTRFWANVFITALRDEGGKLIGFSKLTRDFTERKRVQERLRRSEERFRTLTENAPIGIYRTTPDGRVLVANPTLLRLLGFGSLEELAAFNLERDGIGAHHRREEFKALVESAGEVGGYETVWTRRDGSKVNVRENAKAIRDAQGRTLYYEGTVEDITERTRAEERAYYLAYYDPLTDLPNRRLFEERLTQSVAAAESQGQMLAVVALSLDRFKVVNDTLGHSAGDRLLRGVAERLVGAVRANNTVARFGGDEFSVLLPEMERAEDVAEVVRRIQSALKAPFDIEGQELFVTASAGVGLYPHDGGDAQSLLKNAGAALYRSKQVGGNTFQFYAAEMNDRAFKRLSLEGAMRRALEREEFVLHYQPQVTIDTGHIIGTEALVRWQHPEMGLVPPAEFIPLAEETGLIEQLGEWVLRRALAQTKAWQGQGFPTLMVSVNLSPRQFRRAALIGNIGALLRETKFDPACLELELTEGTIMEDVEGAIGTLRELKGMGIKLSVDDFGSGYSSLSYLKHLPIDILKIDRSFVRDMAADPQDAAIVMAIITLAHSLKLKVKAEGVETEEQLRFLRLLRCDEMQGYLFSKPLPADAFERLLMATNPRLERYEESTS